MKVYIDTETCGLCGPAVTLQYAFENELKGCKTDEDYTNVVKFHEFWKEPIYKSLQLIEELCQYTVTGFNLVFDWFQLQKLHSLFSLFPDEDAIPQEHIEQLGRLEKLARDGKCIKPKSALDLMLHARKTEFQCTMDRKDIKLRRVPTRIAYLIADELEKRIVFQNILFARQKKIGPRWQVYDTGDPDFKNIVLKFKPSVALKALAKQVLGEDPNDIILFSDIEVDKNLWPVEVGYAPFAEAISKPEHGWRVYRKIPGKKYKTKQGYTWPALISKHIDHWHFRERAKLYAKRDIKYTHKLDQYFGDLLGGDDNSILACMVASVRWRGYAIDVEGIKQLREKCKEIAEAYPKAPNRVKEYIGEMLSEAEKVTLNQQGTGKIVLEELAKKVNIKCVCVEALGEPLENCPNCQGKGIFTHPAAERAKNVLAARMSTKEMELYDKLLLAGRLHFSVKITGTLSDRMAGADGLNPQGIKKSKDVRKLFPFAWGGLKFIGGDFESFEVAIADAVYNDPNLRKDLQTKIPCPFCKQTKKLIKKGKEVVCDDCDENGMTAQKIHGLFGMALFPGKTYFEIAASKGSSLDMYDYGKRGVFGMMYGGDHNTLKNRLGIDLETAMKATKLFQLRYPNVGKERQHIFDSFCSMKQVGGIGSRIKWTDPKEYVESLLGFRRYFTLENMICKTLYELANNVPPEWKHLKFKVTRRDREQTAVGAAQSAIFAAAFGIQSQAARAASNHRIQSTGAQATKKLQCAIWEFQPVGVHDWCVQPCNIHDEILCPTKPELCDQVTKKVFETVDSFKPIIPLVAIDWKELNTWADK